jgi:hypothetical protein
MANAESYYTDEDIHPIDMVEDLAEHYEWEFDRVAPDQIAMAIEGQWRNYSITLAWSDYDGMLRLICTFEMEPPEGKLPGLFEAMNHANDMCWTGNFTYWEPQRLMVYRYGHVLAGDAILVPEQIDRLVTSAVVACEKYYPAFQLVCWGNRDPKEAMQVAIAEAYGRA